MNKNNETVAKNYYLAIAASDAEAIEPYLHSDVHFIGPLGEIFGKDLVLSGAIAAADLFKTLSIRTTFSSEDQVVIIYDLTLPDKNEILRCASLMTFESGLIKKNELFYDGRPFDKSSS
jgi:hypothetical protein